MAEDLNNEQSVATQDLKSAGAVNQQDLNQSVTGKPDEMMADGSKKSEKTVKYEEFEKANQKAKDSEEARLLAEQNLAQAVQLNQQMAAQQPQQTAQPGSTYELAMQQLNLTADDLYGENIVRVNARKAELDTAMQQQQSVFSANQQFIQSHPDFTQVVGSVDPTTGRIMAWSQEAMSLKQKKPYLAASFNSAQGAYEAVISERRLAELEKNDAANKEHQNRQGIDIETSPQGGSAAGGGTAGDTNNQKMMSREQVAQIRKDMANDEY